MAVIILDGLRRMCEDEEDVFYYITAMNETYVHPPLPDGSAEGILKGMYRVREGQRGKIRVQLFGAGTILPQHPPKRQWWSAKAPPIPTLRIWRHICAAKYARTERIAKVITPGRGVGVGGRPGSVPTDHPWLLV